MWYDMWYWFLLIPLLLFSLFTQFRVKSTFKKYNQIATKNGLTGAQAASMILNMHNLVNVRIEGVSGELTDHYDPRSNVLRLSDSTRDVNSIAAIGVAAHEAGHAIQDGVNYVPNKIRASLVPAARIGSSSGPYLAIIGVGISYSIEFGMTLAYIGLALYVFAFLFYLVTLPVEFNASSRAIKILNTSGILTSDELKGAKKVLNAAAMTYVASTVSALFSLLRIALIVLGGRRRD
ncbi:MAG TPA: zinc metallopeptidase [Clostridiaceae bacterium]|nr:zinc metallopeptidase [Clostridiaceae bacterium]